MGVNNLLRILSYVFGISVWSKFIKLTKSVNFTPWANHRSGVSLHRP